MNCALRLCSTRAERLILPLVVVGIEPGWTSTRSATLSPCELDIALVTSFLTAPSPSSASLLCIAPFLEFDDGDQLFGLLNRNRYRRYPAIGDLLGRRLDVLGIVVAPVDDQL